MITAIVDLLMLVISFSLVHRAHRFRQASYRIMLGLGLGIGYGLLLKYTPANFLFEFLRSLLYLIGNGYLALLKMVVIPLILTSLIHAILNLGHTQSIKKLSFYSSGLLLVMTAFSSLIGLLIACLFNVGSGLTLPDFIEVPTHAPTTLTNTLIGMLPQNPVTAMTEGNTIALVIFAVLLGVAARSLESNDHEKLLVFRNFIGALFVIVKKLTSLILSLTPYGVLALMALLFLDQGIIMLASMMHFIFAMYVAMALVFIMHSLILSYYGYAPLHYYKKAYLPLLVAFTTRSSFGTLPVTEETLRDKFKTSQETATFVPSIGATLGMNACAGVFPAMLVVMTLTILHQPLTPVMIVMVTFINALASLGISGIPGTAYIAATVTLTSLNLPFAVIALVQGIDPIIDMGRTATNVNGVLTTALIVDRIQL